MDERVKLTIRIPAVLHDKLQSEADNYMTSQNFVICQILSQYFEDTEDENHE